MPKNWIKRIIFLLIFLGLIVRVYKLKTQPFYDWDEGIYAQVAKEIIQNKSLKTTFNGEVWLNKPPLLHLITAFTLYFSNYSETASRLIIAIFSFLTLVFSFKLAKKLFGKEVFAYLTIALLLSSRIYLERSSILNTDIIIALSWVGYIFYMDSFAKKTFFLLLGVWSKSLVGFYPLFFDVLYFIFKKRKKPLSKREIFKYLGGIIAQILLASIWYFYAFYHFGNYFIEAHFLDQIFKRVIKPIESHFGNNLGVLYYPYLFWKDSKILLISFILGIIFLIKETLQKIKKTKILELLKDKNLLLLAFPLPFLGLLIISKSKIYWYVVFILPFLSLIGTYAVFSFKNQKLKRIAFLLIFSFASLSFLNNTFLYHHQPEISERIFLANCVKDLPQKDLAYLVHISERKNHDFLIKNNLHTKTIFIYGGSPSFVYYSNKKPKFFYNVEEFKKNYKNFDIVIIQRNDEIENGIDLSGYEEKCITQNKLAHEQWRVMVKIKN